MVFFWHINCYLKVVFNFKLTNMKASEKVPSKVKNSFIYFQIGLIATMFIVLVVLELKIETKPKQVENPFDGINISEIFVPSEFNVETNSKEQLVKKIIQKTQTQKVSDKVEVKPDDVKVLKDDKLQVDSADKPSDAKTTDDSLQKESNDKPSGKDVIRNSFSIEQFPQFAACKGVSKSQQKKCFDEQLFKEVLKNLQYPSVDASNNKEGVVFLEFVISKTGQIINVSAVSNNRSTEEMKKNAIKALQKVPKMIPAQQGSESVAVKYSLPVSFKITK